VIYLSGKWAGALADMGVGLLCQPNYRMRPFDQLPDGVLWAADTGIFGSRPFILDRYLQMLDLWTPRSGDCLFATAPDVVADWEATLKRSIPVIPTIKAMGYRAALVLQDGATPETVPWQEIDAVFTGGSTAWKLSEDAYRLIAEAKQRGLWAHMGRVNSLRRLRAAEVAGYDSSDGTFLTWAPDGNAKRMQRWFENLNVQPSLSLKGTMGHDI
jgi:hypothetical protein